MATYQKYKLNLGPYHEGNLASIDLEMDPSFPMTGVAVTFQVRTTGDALLIEKKSSEMTITITGQNISIPLLPADTVGHAGNHEYEIDFLNVSSQPFATIGGTFLIDREINR